MAITPEQANPGDQYRFLLVIGMRDLDGFYEGTCRAVAQNEGRTFVAFENVRAVHYPGYASRTSSEPHGMVHDLTSSMIDSACIKAIAHLTPA